MQQVRSAKSSKGGRTARRAVDMLLKQTPISPAYSTIVKAGRMASKPRKNKKNNPSKSISMCCGKFMLAGTDTFSQAAMNACIPDGSVSDSVRCFVKKQILVTIGTAGVGFCHFFHSIANDGVSTVSTDNTFTGTTAQWMALAGAIPVCLVPGVTVGVLPTAYTSAQLLAGWGANDDRAAYSVRIVAAGASFRYTGKEIDRGGQVYCYTHPLHNSAISSFVGAFEVVNTGAVLAGYSETLIVEASREDTHVPMFPVSDNELEYSGETSTQQTDMIYPWSQGAYLQPGSFTASDYYGTRVGIPTTTCMFYGTPGSTYAITYGQHMEVVGLGVAAFSKAPAESDPVGVKDIMAASTRFQLNRKREPGVDPVREFKNAISGIQSDRAVRYNL